MKKTCLQSILPPQPHHVGGYTGFVAGYRDRYGHNFGRTTHSLIFDPEVKRSDNLVLSDTKHFFDPAVVTHEEEDLINKRCKNTLNCKYTTDIMPGYAGYVPQYKFLCGKKYTDDATKAMDNFVKIQEERSVEVDRLMANVRTRSNTQPLEKDDEGEELFMEKYTKTVPTPPTDTIYFLENGNPHKKFMSGYAGHVPTLFLEFGQSYTPATKNALNLFTDQYKAHKLFMY